MLFSCRPSESSDGLLRVTGQRGRWRYTPQSMCSRRAALSACRLSCIPFAVGRFFAQRLALAVGQLNQLAGGKRFHHGVSGVKPRLPIITRSLAQIGIRRIGAVGRNILNAQQITGLRGVGAVAFVVGNKFARIGNLVVVEHRAHQQDNRACGSGGRSSSPFARSCAASRSDALPASRRRARC